MKKRIEELLNGSFRTGAPRLIVSPDRIDETAAFDEVFRGEFHIGTADQTLIRGFVTCDDVRVVFDSGDDSGDRRFEEELRPAEGSDDYGNPAADEIRFTFAGETAAIPFEVNLNGLKPGESVEAVITAVTSVGEKKVPVHIQIEEEAGESLLSSYDLKYLDDFVALAKEDYAEAFRLFSDKRFERLLTGDDACSLTLYRALAQNPVTYQRMEEFLVAAGKKEPVRVTLGQTGESFFNLKETTKEELRLTKNTWGYLNIRVEGSGGFLEVPKKQVTDQDFVGSICDLDYVVHAENCERARQYGRITLTSDHQVLTFDVTASSRGEFRSDKETAVEKSRFRLKTEYLDFRTGRTDLKTWAERSLRTLTAMREMTEFSTGLTLYEAYVCYMGGDKGSASRLIRSLQNHDFTNEPLENKGSFLYLCHVCGLLTPGRIDVVARIRDWCQRDRDSFILLYLLMQVDDDLRRTPIKKIRLMEELYDRGCLSPYLYCEAYDLFKTDGDLMRRLTPFTKQVLWFAVRYDLLTRDIAERAAALCENEKTFTQRMYTILEKSYDRFPSNQTLEAICRLIMKGNPRNPQFFKWYALAVDENIRLTRLYEYYVETMPATYQKPLPLAVKKYFLMSHTVGGMRLAQIYANVVRNRAADEETYREYIKVMAPFTAQALIEGTINEDYAVLYKEGYPTVSDRVVGEALANVMFTARLYCDDPRVRDVVVLHKSLSHEAVTTLRGGVSYINVYAPDAKILFQDEKGRRYASGVAYSLEPLMETDRLTADCRKINVVNTGLLCHICGDDPDKVTVTPENIGSLLAISDSEEFTPYARRAARKKILAYMTDNPLSDSLSPYLREINIGRFARTDKAALLDVLITRGFYDAAYDVVRRYGYEKANTALLVRLVSRKIEEAENAGSHKIDDLLMSLAAFVYSRGKYDEKTLNYLVRGYEGPFETMLAIRKSAEDFYLETYPIDERLLKRAMFIQKPLPEASGILKNYRQMGGSTSVTEAYLIFESQLNLTGQKELEPYEAMLIDEMYVRSKTDQTGLEDEIPLVSKLALLRYYAGKDELTLKEENHVEDLLDEMMAEGVRLSFFRKLPERCLTGYHIKDRIFVEQAALPNDKVTLYYRLTSQSTQRGKDDKAQEDKWIREPLRQAAPGIFSREFVLFYGETLTYYITIDHAGEIFKTPEKTKSMPSVDMTGRSRYQLINQMLSARRLGKTELYAQKEREYRRAEHQAETLFDLIDG